jgi:hypothetical protein
MLEKALRGVREFEKKILNCTCLSVVGRGS